MAIWSKVPPVARPTNANVAAIIGLLIGGIGLGIYFRNVLDFLVPIAIAVILGLVIGDIGILGGIILAGLYGYLRSIESNERLANPNNAPQMQGP